MEMFNFSAGETKRINRALGFIARREVDLEPLTTRTVIVKTENFEDECEQAARYFPALGLESSNARLVFNTSKGGSHKILINKAAINGLSYIHALVTEVVHLGNLSRYTADHGNIYRLDPTQAIADHFHEFLLWTKFQAMRIATRAHALVAWHEINGEEPPEGGRYQFVRIAFPGEGIRTALEGVRAAATLAARREGFWELLEELTLYFGRLAFYQQEPRPAEVDERFPAELVEATVGLANALDFYAALRQAAHYPAWQANKQRIRHLIVAMEQWGAPVADREQ